MPSDSSNVNYPATPNTQNDDPCPRFWVEIPAGPAGGTKIICVAIPWSQIHERIYDPTTGILTVKHGYDNMAVRIYGPGVYNLLVRLCRQRVTDVAADGKGIKRVIWMQLDARRAAPQSTESAELTDIFA